MFNVMTAIRSAGVIPSAAFFGADTANPSSHLSIAAINQTGLGINDYFTGEVWVYTLSYTDPGFRKAIVNRDSNVVNVGINWGFGLSGTNGSEVYFTYTTSPTFGTTRHHDNPHGQGSILNAWHHIAATRDHTNGETKLFLNGVQAGATLVQDAGSNPPVDASPGFLPGNLSVIIGTGSSNLPHQTDFHGYLCEVRVWDVVRTPAEIAANYNQALVGNEAGLKMYLPMTVDFTDATANGNNLSAVAGATQPAPVIAPIARPF